MTTLVDRPDEDQPWVTAAHRRRVSTTTSSSATTTSTAEPKDGDDRAVGSTPAAAPRRPASRRTSVEHRATAQQDAPSVRTAVHGSGVVYGAYLRWVKVIKQTATALDLEVDVIVVRAENWGSRPRRRSPRCVDPGDNVAGLRVASNRVMHFTGSVGPLGQERIGSDLAIAVDPADSGNVCSPGATASAGSTAPTGRCTSATRPTAAHTWSTGRLHGQEREEPVAGRSTTRVRWRCCSSGSWAPAPRRAGRRGCRVDHGRVEHSASARTSCTRRSWLSQPPRQFFPYSATTSG